MIHSLYQGDGRNLKKLKPSGEVRYKAGWVIKGNIMNGHDLEHHKDTYAPVVNPTTTLTLLSVATQYWLF
jgi:hypothetical protein